MKINDYLKTHIGDIHEIINDMNDEFSSHDFIEKFAQKHESNYIDMLKEYQKTQNAFQTIHSMIAKFLSINQSSLNIKKSLRGTSENVFGNEDVIQWWEKTL